MDLREGFRKLLCSEPGSLFNDEESKHQWLHPISISPGDAHALPLNERWAFRVIDDCSQGQLEESGCILAANLEWRLDTKARRYDALKLHSNHQDWSRPSPLISADSSPYSTFNRAMRHVAKGRSNVRISLINNMVRFRAGLPFFSAVNEMLHYGVKDPYLRDYAFYQSEILYPYRITSEEIVFTWDWLTIEEYLKEHGKEQWIQSARILLEQHEQLSVSRWRVRYPNITLNH